MSEIIREDINEEWAHTGVVKAGDFIFTSYCVGNIGESIEKQINGAFDVLDERLAMFGLTVDSVVKIDALFRDIWDIPTMEKVLKERFKSGNYPVRKSIQTEFAHKGGENGLLFQLDAIAYAGDK
ncbi:RidA family protein [Enterococcus sp. BWM-S5]|uniref:RidA family protein n=1 Tax=Enterococcus larvae TaxID=2794352 RepID=A0ABS4CEV5_9ENTE|nr:RidA family protein [Enterococcus larvae]